MDYSKDYNNLPVEEDLHIQAGLVDVGIDEDGFTMWQGTDAQWQDFERLNSLIN